MNVKVGNSYVSEAAYAYAKARAAEGTGVDRLLGELSEAFPGMNLMVGTAPFCGQGMNNVMISPKILREMAQDPEKRLEYEALLYDCNETAKSLPRQMPNGSKVKARGFVITSEGGLRGWGISESDGKQERRQGVLPRKDKKSLIDQLLEKRKAKKAKKTRKETEKASKKESESAEKMEEKSSGKVGFNEGKRARQLAAAKTKNEVNIVLELLQKDLEDCEKGVQDNMCDEAEVKKVKAMIERAKQRLAEVGNEGEDKANNGPSDFSISLLI